MQLQTSVLNNKHLQWNAHKQPTVIFQCANILLQASYFRIDATTCLPLH